MPVSRIVSAIALASLLAPALGQPGALEAQRQTRDPNVVYDPALYQALEYRLIGPHRGGRVTAVAGVPDEPRTFYMGSTGGGVWKTTDGGETWTNISDGFFAAGSMGAIAIADADPNVIYAGTGSACIRGNVSTGIGAYKSTDAGRTWTHTGLRDAGQIGRIRIHPRNPDLVYVAALGHAFGPNPERGVFRSRDGGKNWEKVLHLSDSTGAVDLAMDATNPRILYAAMWRAERKPWTLISGAREGGIYKTTDGGDTWTKLAEGLPTGLTGRIGVAVSPANPDRVWAIIEASDDQGGVYRSDDAGKSWKRVNGEPRYIERPWYYNHIYADPKDEHTVYITGEEFWKSLDGGATFSEIPVPHGDNHDLWINPKDPTIMIEGNDGGANVTFNGGKSWSTQLNQPTSELYSVTVDNAFPYRVYGPQQDNSTISVPSRSEGTGITLQRWLSVGGCETGPIALNPDDPSLIYAGCYGGRITRFDLKTGQAQQVMDYPQMQLGMPVNALKYRFQWNAPIVVSRHDPRVIYHASQHVHRSTNEGHSWEIISPDLTRNDTTKQGFAGGPITHDITGVEVYGTIFALVESPHDPKVLWAGSNDGLVHLTRDGGATWKNVTPKNLAAWSTVNRIEVSPHAPGRALLAVYRYRMDDFRPYVFRTSDYGESWQLLTDGRNGIPANYPVRVVREDPDRRGLLYAGTEFGLFASFDDGAHWQSLQLNLPATPVTDLAVHQKDLVVATQGRSFWMLDDVTPLHQLTEQVAASRYHLSQPRAAHRTPGGRATGHLARDAIGGIRLDTSRVGKNAPDGAVISYWLAEEASGEVVLEILDTEGNLVRRFSSEKREDERDEKLAPKKRGLNRFVWDLRYPGATLAKGVEIRGARDGPLAVPGSYRVRLAVGEWSATTEFEVRKDPRVPTTLAELREQFDLLIRIRDQITAAQDAVRSIRSVREQAKDMAQRVAEREDGGAIVNAADSLSAKLSRIEEQLIQPKGAGVAHQPMLSSQLGWLTSIVASADARPTRQSYQRFDDLSAELDTHLVALRQVLDSDVAAFNALLREQGIAPVVAASGR